MRVVDDEATRVALRAVVSPEAVALMVERARTDETVFDELALLLWLLMGVVFDTTFFGAPNEDCDVD